MTHPALAGLGPRDIPYEWVRDRLRNLLAALAKKIAGLVIDGCVRHVIAIEHLGFAVFARGTAIRDTTKVAKWQVGSEIQIDSVPIQQGDLIVGDADGVVVLRRQ